MANLDTRSKRASSVNFLKPFQLALVLPDGTIAQGDRQHTVYAYAGILATAAAVVSEPAQYSGGVLPPALTLPDWEIWLQRFDGTQLIALTPFALEWEFFVSLNGLNPFSLTLDLPKLQAAGYKDLPLDSMIEFRRTRGAVRMFSFYKRDTDPRTQYTLTAKGYGLNHLLARPNTSAYYAGTSYTVKTGALDDVMKAVVRENMYTSAVNRDTLAADSARDYSQTMGFSVAVDTSAAPSKTIHCAADNVYDLLVKLANTSARDGTRLFFEVFRPGDKTFIFDTRTVCYGTDRRGLRTFGRDNGTMRDTTFSIKRAQEVNYLYVLGQREGALRGIAEVSNDDRMNDSPINRMEGSYNANQTADADLPDVGLRVLETTKPARLFDGELIDAEEARYGKDWELGDILDAKDGKDEFEIMITGVRFRMGAGKNEVIEGTFEVIS